MTARIARADAYRPRISLLSRLVQALALSRQRARLARLDDHLLSDIGLTRDEATREASRPAWDAPAHWRQ